MEVRAAAARSGEVLTAAERGTGPWAGVRAALARLTVARASRVRESAPARADRLLRLAAVLAPAYGPPHTELVELRRSRGDRWGAVSAARDAATRFPDAPDVWMLLGDALQGAFRQDQALAAYESAIALQERPDALSAAGALYRRSGRFADAAARYARAYAAGGDPAALLANAEALAAAGDRAAAEQALGLWATLVENGPTRLPRERARLGLH